jgi:medium-chain acyl-[acyl-carrier-protein] hydrolase
MRSRADAQRWFFCRRANPEARVRLFCFPYAGGSATIFRDWASELPPWMEICPIELPGRWSRRNESMPESLSSLAQKIAHELNAYWDLPIVLFGHSMGALVAFELARSLRRQGISIEHLHVAARGAPRQHDVTLGLHRLPDDELVSALRREYQGISDAVMRDPELLSLVLPVIRADMRALETYEPAIEPPLECPIFVYAGEGDDAVKRPTLHAWNEQTRGQVSLQFLPGGHFFPMTNRGDFFRAFCANVGAQPVAAWGGNPCN